MQRLATAEARIDALEQNLRAVEGPAPRPASATRPARPRLANSKSPAESRPAGRSKAAAGPARLENMPEGARLLANQMADAGVPEEEVKAFLRSTFDLDGGGSGSGKRVD